ncbi:MAG: DNA polymerase III subunit alpha [Firmicutes bacterium]|nr:DNA polymerase III subunit alpha [Bacillota bacterium]
MNKEFAHLHLHTSFSMLDGALKIKDLFKRCHELGITSVAITDHGNMYGALEFAKEAARFSSENEKQDLFDFIKEGKEFKVKPIIGCEVYICDDMKLKNTENKGYYHLVLLAKNEEGYKNLIKLVSLGFIEGLYYKPRIDFELLKLYSEGLVCLSGCYGGHIAQALDKGNLKLANEWAARYKGLFGNDFYIELQDHRMVEQRRILPLLRDVAALNGIKMVATNDVHYLNKEDALTQKVLQNVAFQKTMSFDDDVFKKDGLVDSREGQTGGGDYFPTDEFYLKSGDEMAMFFEGYDGAIENSLEIADKCKCDFFVKKPLLPNYVPQDKSDPYEYLKRLTDEGLNAKYGQISPLIRARADFELETINRLGFVEYFLIVWDFIAYAEKNGVSVGPGRGSGVGSIVAYAVGITKVDPIKYGLIFERFLNPERVSSPDFDIDFCVDGREKVIEYVVNKYGAENVSQIITFSTMAAKAAIKDVGRVFDRPFAELNRITKAMPKLMLKGKIGHVIGTLKNESGDKEIPPAILELVELYKEDADAKRILDMAMKIEGLPRQTGLHAAGVIICKDEIYKHIPMAMNGDGVVSTQFNMNECEELGLLKMDFLGLATLTDISNALNLIEKGGGKRIDFYNMEYNDKEVFKLFGEGDTHAVFQFESAGMKRFMKELKPSSIEDIIAGVALYRPGPMDYIGVYVENKRNPERVKYDHEMMKPILEVTYGVMVYQEQVMDAVRSLAGYSLGRADEIRRMMGKKKFEAMQKERKVFINGSKDGSVIGCIKNGIDEKTANKIYDDMCKFASYAFNKSHAAAYAFLAYQTAYLKCYYPAEYICAVLNNRIGNSDEVANYLRYLKDKGIKVLPPCVNRSGAYFTVEKDQKGDKAVRIGLAALKGVGGNIVELVGGERDRDGAFKDFENFVERLSNVLSEGGRATLNKKLLESLIFAGAFDSFGVNRKQLSQSYEMIVDKYKREAAQKASGQVSLFEVFEGLKDVQKFKYPALSEFELSYKLMMEKEVAGAYLTAHPLDKFEEKLKEFEWNSAEIKKVMGDGEEEISGVIELGGMLVAADVRVAKSGREYGVGVIEDLYGSVELLIMGGALGKNRDAFKKDALVSIRGKVNVRDDGYVLWVDGIEEWKSEGGDGEKVKRVVIKFDNEESARVGMREVREVLGGYEGVDEVFVNYGQGDKKMTGVGVLGCEVLKNELVGCDGVVEVVLE